ncbi:TVP38/TMEM64 family protein [Amphibacillus indicireducens]|uniref:TVP38/TMEM64 family membrane protein n=1 Tax=Amphibacillus indicireducens TaxID=1076330 RepID=A0ABP7VTU8_9BACI
MEQIEQYIDFLRNTHILIAPVLFIVLHGVRSIFFIPVIAICIAGGMIFGVIPGIILSIIGLLLSSVIFYGLAKKMPFITKRLIKMKAKIKTNDKQLTTGQITILRLIPFIHYHLLSFLIYESTEDFRSYVGASFYTVIPMAVVYTAIGQTVVNFSPIASVAMFASLIILLFLSRKKSDRVSVREFLR